MNLETGLVALGFLVAMSTWFIGSSKQHYVISNKPNPTTVNDKKDY